jgi:hypothetical protein
MNKLGILFEKQNEAKRRLLYGDLRNCQQKKFKDIFLYQRLYKAQTMLYSSP